MLFNSYIFILCFLPITLSGYFILNEVLKETKKPSLLWLVVMSMWFYGYFNISYLWIIIISILANYFVGSLLCKWRGVENKNNLSLMRGRRKLIWSIGIVFNLGLLFYFKYYDFFIENINALFKLELAFLRLLLPLGISFYTFQQISYITDCYRCEVNKKYELIEYAAFVTFFPQLIAGPIISQDELLPQLLDKGRKKFDYGNFSKGLYVFSLV